MTRDETKKIIAMSKAFYPNWTIENIPQVIDAWTLVLSEYDYKDIEQALVMFVKTDSKGFAPAVGQLISTAHKPEEVAEISEGEAWAMVHKAIKNGSYGYHEEFSKLPKIVQAGVGREENLRSWAMTTDEGLPVVQSQFLRGFREALRKKHDYLHMPKDMKLKTNALRQEAVKNLVTETVNALPDLERRRPSPDNPLLAELRKHHA